MRYVLLVTLILLAMSATVEAKYRCKSSVTGKWVTVAYAHSHPDVTQCSKRK